MNPSQLLEPNAKAGTAAATYKRYLGPEFAANRRMQASWRELMGCFFKDKAGVKLSSIEASAAARQAIENSTLHVVTCPGPRGKGSESTLEGPAARTAASHTLDRPRHRANAPPSPHTGRGQQRSRGRSRGHSRSRSRSRSRSQTQSENGPQRNTKPTTPAGTKVG